MSLTGKDNLEIIKIKFLEKNIIIITANKNEVVCPSAFNDALFWKIVPAASFDYK